MTKVLFMRFDSSIKVYDAPPMTEHMTIYKGDYMMDPKGIAHDINGKGPPMVIFAQGRILPHGVNQAADTSVTMRLPDGSFQNCMVNNALTDEMDRMMTANFMHKTFKSKRFGFLQWLVEHPFIIVGLLGVAVVIMLFISGVIKL